MNTYIRERLRADSGHVVARSRAEEGIQHSGIRGRFRELLVDLLLSPWLPAPATCGTGMIVDAFDRVREATQEDVVIFDRSLVPPVLAHPTASDGVFPIDGVLARVEVKSTLTADGIRRAVMAGKEIYEMKFSGSRGKVSTLPISTIFAFSSDLTGDPSDELGRLLRIVEECGLHYRRPCHEVPGPIGALCVVGRGAWSYGTAEDGEARWLQAKTDPLHEEIIHFVGALSNSCFAVAADRRGRDPKRESRGAGGGIGGFVLSNDTYVTSAVQLPPMMR